MSQGSRARPSRVVVVAVAAVAAVAASALGACSASPECKTYVECQNLLDPEVPTADYEDGGSCWTTLQTAQTCTNQCIAALDAIAEADDSEDPTDFPAECLPPS